MEIKDVSIYIVIGIISHLIISLVNAVYIQNISSISGIPEPGTIFNPQDNARRRIWLSVLRNIIIWVLPLILFVAAAYLTENRTNLSNISDLAKEVTSIFGLLLTGISILPIILLFLYPQIQLSGLSTFGQFFVTSLFIRPSYSSLIIPNLFLNITSNFQYALLGVAVIILYQLFEASNMNTRSSEHDLYKSPEMPEIEDQDGPEE